MDATLNPLGQTKAPRAAEPSSKSSRAEEQPEEDDGDAEVKHFMDVSYSLADYERLATQMIYQFEIRHREAIADPLLKHMWTHHEIPNIPNFDAYLETMVQCVRHNQQALMDRLVENLAENMVGPPSGLGVYAPPPGELQVPDGYQVSHENMSKAFSTIKQFVRDWSLEGKAERDMCYGPLIQALDRYVPLTSREGGYLPVGVPFPAHGLKNVLTPGSGLGRLTFDVARRGYFCEGNEMSYHMLLGTMWILNECEKAFDTLIYPYVLDCSHRYRRSDNLRFVRVPDVCPSDFCDPASGFGEISMRGGEFCDVYKNDFQRFHAVLTAFFIDTANNVFEYIRSIAYILQPEGLWANMGPLLWHYSPAGGGDYDAVSIELAWEEVRPAIEVYFEIKEFSRKDALYTGNSGRRKVYHCIFFAAVRNTVPASGRSNPVR